MKKFSAVLASAVIILAGCSTTTQVKLPADSTVRFDDHVEKYSQGDIKRRPFFWNTTGGIPYKVEKDGSVLSEGEVSSRFRVVSIFWPPYALIYWPMGFAEECYDLTDATPKSCIPTNSYHK